MSKHTLTYESATDILNAARGGRKKIDHNTWLERENGNGDPVVRLHETNVITFRPNGCIVLRTGGWSTATTKDRINKFSGLTVFQRRCKWFVDHHDGDVLDFAEGAAYRLPLKTAANV